MGVEWVSWSGAVRCHPHAFERPTSEAEVVALVRRTAADGRGLRVVGSGHSSTALVATDGVLLSLDRLAGIECASPEVGTATARAGTKLHDLGPALLERGLAMENLGDVDTQTLAGAVATGTHGTGHTLPNLSAQVTGLRLVTADGAVLECDAERDPDAFRAARVSLGAFGVVTALRLRLQPAYRLHERVWRAPLAEILEKLDALIHATRHFEFFYFPRHDFAEAKALHPTDADPASVAGRPGERIDWSGRVLASVREQKFHEMEYALPAEQGPACLRAVVERVRSRHPEVVWPLEYRTVAADDAWLSPAHGRATVALSVHQDGRFPYGELFADVEPILLEHGGRPHWGKHHGTDARVLAPRYPGWEVFQTVRRRLDTSGRFLNDHLRRLFGA